MTSHCVKSPFRQHLTGAIYANLQCNELLRSALKIHDSNCQRIQGPVNIYLTITLPFANRIMAASYFDHDVVLEWLLDDTNTTEIDLKDAEYRRTPLSLAVENGCTELVKLLIEKDTVEIDSKDNNSRTSLSWGAENGHEAVIKLLLETSKVNVDWKDSYGRTPLSIAAAEGHEPRGQTVDREGQS
jgi:ankyrin repeat protein